MQGWGSPHGLVLRAQCGQAIGRLWVWGSWAEVEKSISRVLQVILFVHSRFDPAFGKDQNCPTHKPYAFLCVEMGSRFHWRQREKERAKTWVSWKVQSPDFLEISSFRNTPTPITFLVSIIHFNSYKKAIIKVGMRGKEKVRLKANPFLSSETPLWSGFKIFTGDSLLYSCVVFKAGAVLQGGLGVSGISRLSFLIFSLCTGEGSISIVLHNATGQVFGHYSISGWGVHQILKHPKKTAGYYF